MRRNFNRPQKRGTGKLALLRIERISIQRSNRGDANVPSLRLTCKLLGKGLPVLFLRRRATRLESVPTNGPKTIPLRPIQPRYICVSNESDPHLTFLPI